MFGLAENSSEEVGPVVRNLLPSSVSGAVQVSHLGKKADNQSTQCHPRPVLVKLTRDAKRDLMASRAALTFSGSRVYVGHDLTAKERASRKSILPKFKLQRERGVSCSLPRSQILIDGKVAGMAEVDRLLAQD